MTDNYIGNYKCYLFSYKIALYQKYVQVFTLTREGCNEVTADVKTKITRVCYVLQRCVTPLDIRG